MVSKIFKAIWTAHTMFNILIHWFSALICLHSIFTCGDILYVKYFKLLKFDVSLIFVLTKSINDFFMYTQRIYTLNKILTNDSLTNSSGFQVIANYIFIG